MPKKSVDYSLYLVTDQALALGRDIVSVVERAVRGGVTVVQVREKNRETRDFLNISIRIKKTLENHNIPLIINDRIDIALAVGADGVHLGQNDMPIDIARRILGPDRIIGISVSTVDEAIEAENGGADYLAISPVWSTKTKINTPEEVGLEGIDRIRKVTDLPLVGIGNIKVENAKSVISAGCNGIAVVSAIMSAPDPELAARKLLRTIMVQL